jgi:hypothetical protein
MAFISLIIIALRIVRFSAVNKENQKILSLSNNSQDYALLGFSILAFILGILKYILEVLSPSEYGPTASFKDILSMPEFQSRGRVPYLDTNPLDFWFFNNEGSLFSAEWAELFRNNLWIFNPLMTLFIIFPVLLIYRRKFTLIRVFNSRGVFLLIQIFIASLVMYAIAHLFIYKFYLPNRYTQLTFRLIFIILSSVSITVILDRIFEICQKNKNISIKLLVIFLWGCLAIIGFYWWEFYSFVPHTRKVIALLFSVSIAIIMTTIWTNLKQIKFYIARKICLFTTLITLGFALLFFPVNSIYKIASYPDLYDFLRRSQNHL